MNAEDPFVRALTGDEGEQTITLIRRLRAPVADVWSALTAPDRIARWYGTITGPVPRTVGDAFQVGDHGFKRDVADIPVGQTVAALVIANELIVGRKPFHPMPPDRTFPFILKV